MNLRRRTRGVTLTEVCCVLAVVLILLSLSLPAISAAREAFRRIQCQSNIRQIGLGVIAASDVQNRLPESRFVFNDSSISTIDRTWMASAYPFIHDVRELPQTATSFDLAHLPRFSLPNALHFCPSSPTRTPLQGIAKSFNGEVDPNATTYPGDYCGNFGIMTRTEEVPMAQGPFTVLFGDTASTPLSAFRAGRSNTLLMWECSNASYYWRSGPGITYEEPWSIRVNRIVARGQIWCARLCEESQPVKNEGTMNAYFLSYYGGPTGTISLFGEDRQLYLEQGDGTKPINQVLNITNLFGKPFSFHPGIVVMVSADGATHCMSENIDRTVLLALATLNDETGNFEIE